MPKLSNDQCTQAIYDRREFSNRTGSLRGEWIEPRSLSRVRPGALPESWCSVWERFGDLPEVWRDRFVADLLTGELYVVWSYETPIAWARKDDVRLTVPNVTYSLTTSQHQQSCLHGEVNRVDGRRHTGDYVSLGALVGERISLMRRGQRNYYGAPNTYRDYPVSNYGARSGGW